MEADNNLEKYQESTSSLPFFNSQKLITSNFSPSQHSKSQFFNSHSQDKSVYQEKEISPESKELSSILKIT